MRNSGIPVVASTRTGGGEVPPSDEGQIGSGFLNPQKSRIWLGLMLAQGKSMGEIREAFGKVAVP